MVSAERFELSITGSGDPGLVHLDDALVGRGCRIRTDVSWVEAMILSDWMKPPTGLPGVDRTRGLTLRRSALCPTELPGEDGGR